MLPAFFNGNVWLADFPHGVWRQTVCKDQLQTNKQCTIQIKLQNSFMKSSQPKSSNALDVQLSDVPEQKHCKDITWVLTNTPDSQYHLIRPVSIRCIRQKKKKKKAESSFDKVQLLTCRSLGAWTLAVPDLALRATLWITRLGPGLSTSISTRALNSSGGPNSPATQNKAVSTQLLWKMLAQIYTQIHIQKQIKKIIICTWRGKNLVITITYQYLILHWISEVH